MVMAFGFGQEEARRFALECVHLDPECAMCQWLLAYSWSPFLNHATIGNATVFGLARTAAARAVSCEL